MRRDADILGVYMAHRGELVSYASGIVGDRASGEDVVQEAYLRFVDASRSRPVEEPTGYLYRIVRNLALDGRRRLTREALHVAADTGGAVEQIAADHPSPEAEAVGKDEMRLMMAALAELPDRTRIALEMHRFRGAKLQDIAKHLGVSVGTAHALVIDGLEHCRARLCRSA